MQQTQNTHIGMEQEGIHNREDAGQVLEEQAVQQQYSSHKSKSSSLHENQAEHNNENNYYQDQTYELNNQLPSPTEKVADIEHSHQTDPGHNQVVYNLQDSSPVRFPESDSSPDVIRAPETEQIEGQVEQSPEARVNYNNQAQEQSYQEETYQENVQGIYSQSPKVQAHISEPDYVQDPQQDEQSGDSNREQDEKQEQEQANNHDQQKQEYTDLVEQKPNDDYEVEVHDYQNQISGIHQQYQQNAAASSLSDVQRSHSELSADSQKQTNNMEIASSVPLQEEQSQTAKIDSVSQQNQAVNGPHHQFDENSSKHVADPQPNQEPELLAPSPGLGKEEQESKQIRAVASQEQQLVQEQTHKPQEPLEIEKAIKLLGAAAGVTAVSALAANLKKKEEQPPIIEKKVSGAPEPEEHAVQTVSPLPRKQVESESFVLPIQPSILPIDVGNMLSSAFVERRQQNITYFTRFVKNRNLYTLRHTAFLDNISRSLTKNCDSTYRFFKESGAYFRELAQQYRRFYDNAMSQVSVLDYLLIKNKKSTSGATRSKQREAWSAELTNGARQMIFHKNHLAEKSRAFQYYLINTTASNLEKYAKEYSDMCIGQEKQSRLFREKFCAAEESYLAQAKDVNKKLLKYQKNPEDKPSYDLLEEELKFLQAVDTVQKALREWGMHQLGWWNRIIAAEEKLVGVYKETLASYLGALKDMHLFEEIQKVQAYFQGINAAPQITDKHSPRNMLLVTSLDFVKSSLEVMNQKKLEGMALSVQDLQTVVQINHDERVFGRRSTLFNTLVIKTFDAKINSKNGAVDVVVATTVDDNIVIVQKQTFRLIKRIVLKKLYNTRKSENTVSINEKVSGLIFDSWNCEVVEFPDGDMAEEFMFLTENQTDIKNKYII